MRSKLTPFFLAVGLGISLLCSRSADLSGQPPPEPSKYTDWKIYNGSSDGIHYSALKQIDTSNVQRLKVAWTYDTGDAFAGSELECNPIIVDGVLYATTPKLRVAALNAGTGELIWSFDPRSATDPDRKARNRGVTYWTDGKEARIFVAFRYRLYALDARSGKPIENFGQYGTVDLRQDLGRDPESQNISLTTPGIIYKDLLIIGSITSEDLPAAPGDIRAYDVRTGKLRWTFHTIPHPGEYGYNTVPSNAWEHSGAANDWAGMALDETRGLVFVPTGSLAFDFYGADRKGNDLFANTLLALDAATGKLVWHFQAVRHDVWDRDLPAPPDLVTLHRGGRVIDAVAQTTKSGWVFVFDRETGKPIFPIEYRRVPASDVPGEQTAETQPFPLAPPPYTRQTLTRDLITDRTPEAHAAVLARFEQLRSGGQFIPPSLQGTVVFPGTDGGAEWGGAAFDPESGLLLVNANEVPFVIRLVKRSTTAAHSGIGLYQNNCASCHRPDRKGTPPEFPSLVDVGSRLPADEIKTTIRKGGGRMPPFTQLTDAAVSAIVDYLIKGEDKEVVSARTTQGPAPLPYTIDGYNKLFDPEGYPGIKPPWGTLTAIDLNGGKLAWQVPLGEYPKLAANGMARTGTENYGGPVVTAGGLVFIAASIWDNKIRAFDKSNGKLLWQAPLPAAGAATPAIYEIDGREFIVIACGGGKWGASSGGSYVAFALPEQAP